MKKKVFSLLFSLVILAGALFGPLSPGLTAAAFQPTDFEVSAEGAMLVSLDTGGVLYAKNIDARLYPASLTKIMTALIVVEETEDLDGTMVLPSDFFSDLYAENASMAARTAGSSPAITVWAGEL